jgi:GAF domain-containing protein
LNACGNVAHSVREVQAIGAVPQVLDSVALITGLRCVAVARVTEDAWTTCAVRDALDVGLQIGDGLDVATTLRREARSSGESIVIGHVQESAQYRDHHTPRMHGFQRYFSVPILRPDGSYFGTLCGLDPEPAALSAPATVSTPELFAELIS